MDERVVKNDELVLKIIGKLNVDLELENNLEKQIKIKNTIEEVIFNYDIYKKETGLMVSDLHIYLDEFLLNCKLERYSEHTIRNYKYKIGKFCRAVKKPLNQINSNDLKLYFAVATKNSKISTRNELVMKFRTFFTWLVDEGYIKDNPMRKIKLIKNDVEKKKPINDEDLERLRDACEDIREKLIVEMLLSSGVRVGGLVNIKLKDIDLVNKKAYAWSKNRTENRIYFNAKTKLLIEEYIKNYRKGDSEYLFVSKTKPFKQLSVRSMEITIKKIKEKAGLSSLDITPHTYRRTFATNCIKRGIPLETVRELLNHKSIATTERYVTMAEDNVKNQYNRVY